MKNIIAILLLITLIMPVSAYYDSSNDSEILYLYEANNIQIDFRDNLAGINPNKTMCVNSTCIAGYCNNYVADAYSLDYDFTYRLSETDYKTVIVKIEQTVESSTWFNNYVNRKVYLDGQEIIHNNNIKISKYIVHAPCHVAFCFADQSVSLDDKIVYNQTLLFNELTMYDQKVLLSLDNDNQIVWLFETLSDDESARKALKGLAGIFYNILDNVPKIGKAIQNIIYLPLMLIQSIINFTATFIMLIITDWYYAIMLLEIICMAKALKQKNIYGIAKEFLVTHIIIIMYVKDHIIIPFIQLILQLIVIIRNMFRI